MILKRIVIALCALLTVAASFAESEHSDPQPEAHGSDHRDTHRAEHQIHSTAGGHHGTELWHNHPQHLSVVIGGTDDREHRAETFGIDYEVRVNHRIGLGVVAERAVDPIKATTLLAVADIHLWRGWVVQTGPGVELIEHHGHDEELFVYRVGTLYEFEFGRLTFSPQLHLDVTRETESVVFAVAFGLAF